MKIYLLIIVVLISALSGCVALEKYPALYATASITQNDSNISLTNVTLDMEMVSKLKVPRGNQAPKSYPYIVIVGYSKQQQITPIAVSEYNGTGTYTFVIPIRENKTPQYRDQMNFEMRFFNETSNFNRAYFHAKWLWNESESDAQ